MRFKARGDASRALTMTRRGARLGFRVLRGRATYRWTRTLPSVEEAERVRQCIERAIKLAGYTDIDGEDVKLPPPDPLQRWKEACLDDPDAIVVYGDVLAEKGDPRAELIAAHEADVPEAARLEARFTAQILGGLARAQGFAEVTWRRGFLWHVTIAPDLEGEPEYDEYYGERRAYPPNDLGASLLRLCTEPSAELLRSLTIRHHRTPTEEIFALVVALLPQALSRLTLEGSEGDVTEMLDALPRLERLAVDAHRVTISEPVHAPRLVSLDLQCHLDASSARALVESELPRLERIFVARPPPGDDGASRLRQRFGARWNAVSDTDDFAG